MQPDKGVQQKDLKKRSKFVDKLHTISEVESDDSDLSLNYYNENLSFFEEQDSIQLNHDFGASDIEEKILIAEEQSVPDIDFEQHPLYKRESDSIDQGPSPRFSSMKASSNVVDSSCRQDVDNDIARMEKTGTAVS